jgi:hypothetical protein
VKDTGPASDRQGKYPSPYTLCRVLFRQIMRMLRFGWKTKVTAYAHYLPLDYRISSYQRNAIFDQSAPHS